MEVFNKLKQISKSQNSKTIFSNFGYLSLLQIAGYVFPLITMPYLARVIGPTGFGKIAFAAAFIAWFQTFVDWGFNFTATRDVAKCREQLDEVSLIFSRVLWAKLLLMVISLAVICVLILVVPLFRNNMYAILATFLIIPGYIMFPDWLFQALERMKYITLFSILSKLLFTILVFVFIKDKDDYILQPIFSSLGMIFCGAIAMYVIIKKWGIKIQLVPLKHVLLTIKKGTDVFLNNLLPNLYNSFSAMLLGAWCGSISNGILDAGNKFVNIFHQFEAVVTRVFYPYLARHGEKHRLYATANLIFSICLTIILFITAPLLIKIFFTEEFADSIIVLRIMSFSLIFLAMNNIYGLNYMILKGFEKELRNMTFCCTIIGFIMSFPFIYYFDYIGAAMTICISRGLIGVAPMWFTIKDRRRKVA